MKKWIRHLVLSKNKEANEIEKILLSLQTFDIRKWKDWLSWQNFNLPVFIHIQKEIKKQFYLLCIYWSLYSTSLAVWITTVKLLTQHNASVMWLMWFSGTWVLCQHISYFLFVILNLSAKQIGAHTTFFFSSLHYLSVSNSRFHL